MLNHTDKDAAAGAQASNRLPVLAAEIVAAHDDVRAFEAKALERSITAGRLLIEAKECVGHGKWLHWLKANVTFTERTAQRYMRLATAASNPTCRVVFKKMGVQEALDFLDVMESVPLPKDGRFSFGYWNFDDERRWILVTVLRANNEPVDGEHFYHVAIQHYREGTEAVDCWMLERPVLGLMGVNIVFRTKFPVPFKWFGDIKPGPDDYEFLNRMREVAHA